jgi:signal transduction histidine kinase
MGALRLRMGRIVQGLRRGLPPRTIRMRLAVLFFALIVACGAVLLAVTVAVWQGRTGGLTAAPSPNGGVVRATGSTQQSADRDQLLIASGIALSIMAGVSLALGWLVAGRFLRPLRRITATTREISSTNLHERLNLVGPDDELKELGNTFDDLLARLERSFRFERQFVANASHELRTPLAAMRTSLDVAMAKPGPVPSHIHTLADRFRRELDQVDRLLEGFLTLAHAQHGPVADQSVLSLAEAARAAVEQRTEAIALLGMDIEQRECPEAWVTGSETLLSRMVENVVDNAINHNQPGGWVRITTAVKGQVACFVAENGGSAIDPDDVKELARPFRRIGAQRTGQDKGAGLGLAIVASIAEVHGGTLDLRARSDGGLRVAITLPLATSTADGART